MRGSCILCLWILFPSAFTLAQTGDSISISAAGQSDETRGWGEYEGREISQLRILGLRRTKRNVLLWRLKSKPGRVFSAENLRYDIQALYNTRVLYQIESVVLPDPENRQKVIITITVIDKWTLFPFFNAEGGGGSLHYGGGIYDANLLGQLVELSLTGHVYNGYFSWSMSASQEYVFGSSSTLEVLVANSEKPSDVFSQDGRILGNYAFLRREQAITIGSPEMERVRGQIRLSHVEDQLIQQENVRIDVPTGHQIRLNPSVSWGRVDVSEFLESGTEMDLSALGANWIQSPWGFQKISVSGKAVSRGPAQSNFGVYLFTGMMSPASPVDEFSLGGLKNIRGFSDNRQRGRNVAYGNLEARPKLVSTRVPFFELGPLVVQGCVFMDAGSAWGDTLLTGEESNVHPNWLWSAGAGIRVHFVHFAYAVIRLDWSRTITPDEGNGISFGVGQMF